MILYIKENPKKIYINESKLLTLGGIEWNYSDNSIKKINEKTTNNESFGTRHLIFEGNDNEKRAKNYIRQSNICNNEESVLKFFNTIRNIFSSSDPKSYAYKHIQGIVKMVLDGALCYDNNGNIILSKDGTPKLDDNKIISLLQRISIAEELESKNGKIYDNSFRIIGNNIDNTYDNFVDSNTLPSKKDYLSSLIEKYTEFTTKNDYNIIRIPSFNVAKMFAPYAPDLCYLHRITKYNSYGGDNRIFLAIKKNVNDLNEIPIKKSEFATIGRMNPFATSIIGIAVFKIAKKKIEYELVSTNSRYSWTNGATNHDYTFDELSKILGINVRNWLFKTFGTNNLALNVEKARSSSKVASSQF